MFYSFPVFVPPYDSALAIAKTPLKLTYGIIHKVDFVFPSGCLGLVDFVVFDNTHQVWPTNPGSYFCSDGETITFREHLPLLQQPFELYVYSWSVDYTFAHTITIRIGILPVRVLAPWLLPYNERVLAALGSD